MTDTIMDMELKLADVLKPDQLMEGDIILIEGEYFTIVDIIPGDGNYEVTAFNDYDETVEFLIDDEKEVSLFVYVE